MKTKSDGTRDKVFILLMVLVAGCVDAIGFKCAEIFPANMTGNAVLIAFSLAGTSPMATQGWSPALVLMTFALGSALAALMIHFLSQRRPRSVAPVLLLAGVILAACGLSLLLKGNGIQPRTNAFSFAHLLAIALAMGMQSTAALSMNISGAGITTVITSTLTTGISKLVSGLCCLCSEKKEEPSTASSFPLIVFGTYLSGAFLGAVHWGISTPALIFVSGLILAGVGLAKGTATKNAVAVQD
jgi:uncharacterized membrane protein YoaK (UPF0700 family)